MGDGAMEVAVHLAGCMHAELAADGCLAGWLPGYWIVRRIMCQHHEAQYACDVAHVRLYAQYAHGRSYLWPSTCSGCMKQALGRTRSYVRLATTAT
jgi:hypothetical protein